MSQNTLWIGDIDPWMDESYIENIFSSIAPIKSIKVMKKFGQSIGYGFIEFETEEIATNVLQTYNGKSIVGYNKLLKLSRAQYNLSKKGEEEVQIYICDMDLNINEDQLKEFFTQSFSSVVSAKIICDPITRVSKGYGFVKFSNSEDANKAVVEMNGKIMNNKKIRVK
jgi:RNA recognition motif-containing protein